MSSHDRKNKIALLWFVQSVVITSAIAYLLLRYLNLPGPAASAFLGVIYATLCGLSVTGAFLMVFHFGVSRAETSIISSPRYQLPIVFMAQGIAYVAHIRNFMTLDVFFMTTVMLQAISTHATFRMALKGFKIPEELVKKISRFSALSILLLAIIGWRLTNFWSLESVTVGSTLFFSFINSFGLLIIALTYCMHPKLQIDLNSIWNSYILRIESNQDRPGKIFNMTLIASFLQLFGQIYLLNSFTSFTGDDYITDCP